MRPLLGLALLASLLPPAAAGAQQAPRRAEVIARLDSLVSAFMAAAPSAGLTAAVVRGQDTLLLRGYGEADREQHRPAAAGTVWHVASVSKQFTAATILQLAQEGRISLDDTLGRFLPAYPRWSGLTLRQLLTHTSGVHDHSTLPALQARIAEELPVDTVLGFVKDLPLDFPPGTKFNYSNTGYLLLALVAERVSGAPFERVLHERHFAPLGMRTAGYCRGAPGADDAIGYRGDGGNVRRAAVTSRSLSLGSGGLCMSVPDFLRWQGALTSGRVVPAATYAMMIRPALLADGTPTRYGYALAPAELAGHRLVRHPGDVPGFSAEQVWLPDDSLRVVVFTNMQGRTPYPLVRNLAAAVLGLPLERPRSQVAVALDPARVAAYVGTYGVRQPAGNTTVIRITAEDGVVMMQPGANPKFPLVYLGDDTFGNATDPEFRITIVVANGQGVKLIRRNALNTVEGPRLP